MKLRRTWWLGVVAAVVAVPAAVAAAQTTTTAGEGITVESKPGQLQCTPSDTELTPGTGQESFLFVLTSPAGTDSTLTVQTDAGKTYTFTGEADQASGNIKFIVTIPADETITSASATGGTENSQLTISHCELGPTPTTTTVTTTPAATTAPPAKPAAVVVQPRLTG